MAAVGGARSSAVTESHVSQLQYEVWDSQHGLKADWTPLRPRRLPLVLSVRVKWT